MGCGEEGKERNEMEEKSAKLPDKKWVWWV